ncbi:hypothetical protein ASG67_05190 [Sphingomonas sp. Leaf339]|uniref:DUF2497 domain-containing protein n=1 Tax=Sphingomonas sp. Leaf339 TaxID=1736343 RepID=UPI0006F687CB|nr:DUF2497 domain-containing protein [Sphingomonas sp. Leaf339]KQU62474.1 hypothetical protein ASG67_05190 [Sphingomonas sp. Leaf339]
MGDMSAEPSMEEILSSIKRIIAEEGDGPMRNRRAPRTPPPPSIVEEDEDDDTEVLELSDPMPSTPFHETTPDPVIDEPAPRPEAVAPRAAAPVPPVAPPVAAQPAAAPAVDTILSSRAAEASRSSLDSLTRMIVRSDTAGPGNDGTLEGLVREMLRPMLRDWLDSQLPGIVEKMVAAEIARITGQSR